ncbi:diphthine synthase [Candidatus Bathyarchaeota archaeon]|nr:diphthine synthase [Candidatus Bathyarchaeota archaeon]
MVGELVFVGLGLYDHLDISLRGLREVKDAAYIFAEFYTSLMPGFTLDDFRKISGKDVTVVSRRNLEDEGGKAILERARHTKVVLLVPGDPLIATTHIALRLKAEREGIKTKVVHGASVISAVIGLSGLQNYRFGKSVTIPFSEGGRLSKTPYLVVAENKARNLHTLCFLDIRVEENKYMTIKEALETLLALEENNRQGVITGKKLAVGIARAGSEDVMVKADAIKDLVNFDFGRPPHSLILPSEKLHFMEAEALIMLANAPKWVMEMSR